MTGSDLRDDFLFFGVLFVFGVLVEFEMAGAGVGDQEEAAVGDHDAAGPAGVGEL